MDMDKISSNSNIIAMQAKTPTRPSTKDPIREINMVLCPPKDKVVRHPHQRCNSKFPQVMLLTLPSTHMPPMAAIRIM